MNIRPLHDRVIVKRVEAESKTAGGIILPDSAKEKPKEGIIVAIGEGRLSKNGERAPLQVKKKDRVIFSSYAGTEIKVDGQDRLVLREDEVFGVIEN